MSTIVDVARKAGVGVGTVSRVLNDSPAVSAGTRARVLSVIDELEYRPNSLARAFSRGVADTIGALVPTVTRPSSMERLRGVLDELRSSDFDLALFQVEGPGPASGRVRDLLRPDRCAGGLMMSLRISPAEAALVASASTPIVIIDGRVEGLPGCYIDNVAGGRLATQHLLDLGHRHIAFVGDVEDEIGFNPGARRYEGYRAALLAAGLPVRDDLVKTGPHDRDAARRQTLDLFRLAEVPTAIVATSDSQALGVMTAVQMLGLRVPEDVSVTGFDDLEIAAHMGLTTIRQPLYESGVIGARMLLDLLGGDEGPTTAAELPLELIVRASTAPPCTASPD